LAGFTVVDLKSTDVGRLVLNDTHWAPPQRAFGLIGNTLDLHNIQTVALLFVLAHSHASAPTQLTGERANIRRIVHRNNTLTSNSIHHKVTRGGEKEGFCEMGSCRAGAFVDTSINFLTQIWHICSARAYPPEIAHKRSLMREDLGGKPMI
jgi:hypothetical protein